MIKNYLLLLMLLVSFISYGQKTYYGYGGSSASNKQQISLFDNQGDARAYIDFDEDATIFMWDGTPVGFLDKDGNDICVFGFRGGFLGWYENGMIYDKDGYIVGARKESLNVMTKMERMKGMQKMTPMRPMTSMTPMKPFWKNRWSATSLTEFLYFGRK